MRARIAAIGELLLGKGESALLRQRITTALAGLLSLRVAFGAIAFGITVMLARLLGRSGLGTYNYVLSWITLLGAPVILGLDQLLVREIPAYSERDDWGLVHGIVRAANGIVGIMAAVVIVLTVAVSLLLRNGADPYLFETLWAALVLIPVIALTRVRQAVLQSLHRVVVGSVPERLLLPGLMLAFLLAAWIARVPLDAPIAMGLNVTASLVAFAAGTWLLRRNFPQAAKSAVPTYEMRRWVKDTIPIFLFGSVSVVFAQADTLILGSIAGSHAVGPYSVADKTADLLTIVMVAQNAAFASTAASLKAAGDMKTLQRLTTRIARLTVLATVPAAILFLGFGEWFLTFFYGDAFGVARTALVLLSVGQLVNVAAGLNGMLLVMMGQTNDALMVVGVSAAVNVGLNFLMVPHWGMDGAAAANMISLFVWNALASVELWRKTGIDSTATGLWGRDRSR